MTASAPVTVNVPPALETVPPSVTARDSARNRTEPFTPSMSAETPSSATVAASGLAVVVRCGLSNFAVNEIAPGRLAVSRTAMTWSTALAMTSRRKRVPPATNSTVAVAVSRSSSRRYSDAAPSPVNASRRLPTGW